MAIQDQWGLKKYKLSCYHHTGTLCSWSALTVRVGCTEQPGTLARLPSPRSTGIHCIYHMHNALIYTHVHVMLWSIPSPCHYDHFKRQPTYCFLYNRASSERSGASGSAHVWTNTLIICSAQIHLSNASKGQALLSFSNLLQRGKIQKLLKKSHPQNTCTMTCILSSHFLFLNTYNITFEKWGTEFLFRSFLNF